MAGRKAGAFAVLAALAVPAAAHAAVDVDVDAKSNVFAAGLGAVGGGWSGGPTGGGSLPPAVALDGARTIVLESVTGTWTCQGNWQFVGPEGDCYNLAAQTNLTTPTNVAGIVATSEAMLTGVFVGPGVPSGPAPARLNFRPGFLTETFAAVSPLAQQTFYMGDGIGDPGVQQRFRVPAGATRLFLGMADGGSSYGFNGVAGWYQDNSGSLSVAVSSLVVDCEATSWGSPGNDTVSLGSTNDAYAAGDGDDNVNAGSGNDCVHGGGGNDTLAGGSGADQVDAGDGDDAINGGSGDDRIHAGGGIDSVSAGGGADRIDVRDGAGGDVVECGGDFDRYRADPGDVIAADCEQSAELL